jgi:hypothetical protein
MGLLGQQGHPHNDWASSVPSVYLSGGTHGTNQTKTNG